MKNKISKRILAIFLALCLVIPTVAYVGSVFEAKAAGEDWTEEVGDTDGDGVIDAMELVRIKKNTSSSEEKYDLNNDGSYDATDAKLMREFLVGKIYSFYRSDTSEVNNDTLTYQVTDELDREMTDSTEMKAQKEVGIRYFIHFGLDDMKALYSVSNILTTDANAYASSSAWESAGGGAVGTDHWWGEPLFGYFTSLDKWVVERDVQMLTDAGIDFIAVDVEDGVHTAQLTLLLETLKKFSDQGFNVPKVTFTSDVSSDVSSLKSTYSDLWYTEDTISALDVTTVKVAENMGYAMSASAFYGNSYNHQRNYNGRKHLTGANAALEGAHLEWQFQKAIEADADIILVESWNEWLSTREDGTDSEPIVLENNADMSNSSDIQPMNGGYGDDYYMQLVDCIKAFKGDSITNNNLNTVRETESTTIDVNGDFNQWNKVSTHYLDYTSEIDDRDAEAYAGVEVESNSMLAFQPRFSDSSTLITKESYKKGSIVSFRAYVPKGVTLTTSSGEPWWRVCTTQDQSSADIYTGSGSWWYASPTSSELGTWVTKTYTLTSDGYIYFAGEAGQWVDSSGDPITILIDDFKVTTDSEVKTEDFENGIDGGLFKSATGTAFSISSESVIKTNQAAAMYLEYGNETWDVITKNAYPGGSTVTFDAFVPEDITPNSGWWGVAPVASQTGTDIYAVASGYSLYDSSKLGVWATYTVNIPNDGQSYYLGIGGAVGSGSDWNENALLIDNFKVTSASGDVLALEDFNSGLNGIFKINTTGSNGNTCVSTSQIPTIYTDTSGRNDVSKMKMTSDGEYLYALVETVDDIQGFGEANCMSLFLSTANVGGCWNQYEYVVNRDSSKATSTELVIEQYVGGAWVETGKAAYRKAGNLMHLAIPLTAIGSSDAFDLEFKWADNYSEQDVYSFYTTGDAAPYGRANYVYEVVGQQAEITVNNMSSVDGKMSFITKKAYPAGSTVEFDILIPENTSNSWWGIGYATSTTAAGLYNHSSAAMNLPVTLGSWSHCSFTLPEGDGSYYIYLLAAVGEWPMNGVGKAQEGEPNTIFYLDNFEIKDTDGNVTRETFNSSSSIFDTDASVEIKAVADVESNLAAELRFQYANANPGGFNFITKNAYPKGSKVVFDAYVQSGEKDTWWGAKATATPNSVDIYGLYTDWLTSESILDDWDEFTVDITEDGQYVAFVGASGEWENRYVYIDNVRVYDANGKLIAKDDFRAGLHDGIFNVTELTGNDVAVSLGYPGEEKAVSGDLVLAIANDKTSDNALFISADNYPAGSTITFDAYVPSGTTSSWWGVDSTTSKSDLDIYSAWNQDVEYEAGWATYTVELPESGGPYYFTFVTEQNSSVWTSKLLIDNVIVKDADGNILAEDNFNYANINSSMFEILVKDGATLVLKEEEAGISFTAYDSPTFDGQVDGIVADKIDAAYKKMAEAGFNKALALREGYTTVAEAQAQSSDLYTWIKWRSDYLEGKVATSLNLAEKYGMKYYVKDWSFYGLGRTGGDEATVGTELVNTEEQFSKIISDMFDETNPYLKHAAYAGNYAIDEPGNNDTDFQALKWQAKYYNQAMQNLGKEGEIFVNLNPAYGAQDDRNWFEQLIGSAINKYDTDYVNKYVGKYMQIAKDDATKINYISWDYYPFMTEGHENKTLREENYLYNFKVMRNAVENTDMGLRLTLQASSESSHGLRDVNAADLRFQIYTGMAFGVNDFTYYKYSGTNGEGIFDYSSGETNETRYNNAKEVNNEVHAIEDIFADYKWADIMAERGSVHQTAMSKNMINGMQFADNKDKNIAYGNITDVVATEDTIAGIFTAVDGMSSRPYGYMFVNLSDPALKYTDTVTITFADSVKKVLVCQNGTKKVMSVSEASTLTLEAGEGAFIVPIQ